MAGLDIALLNGKSSLLARQRQMNVTGNNITHAGQAGYHRQTTEMQENPAVDDRPGQLGTGARVARVVRVFDQALENNLLQGTTEDGYHQASATTLEYLEKMTAPDGTSPLAVAVQDFAAAWQGLATEPESQVCRQSVIAQSQLVATQFNATRAVAVQVQSGLADATGQGALQESVAELNRLAAEVAELNRQILQIESRRFNPQQANDLRDRRDIAVGEIAKLTDVTITRNQDSTYTLDIGGTTLVSSSGTAAAISVAMGMTGPSLTWQATGTPVTQQSGETKALLDTYGSMTAWLQSLDTFASTFAAAVNSVHTAGFDKAGAPGTSLFSFNAGTGTLQTLITQADKLAAATVSGTAGDGTNAQALWAALDSGRAALGGNSLLNHADRLVDSLAQDTRTARTAADNSSASVAMLSEAVGSVSGVSLDQEMMQMLDLQRAYQASAKFISVVDGLLGTVIGMVSA